MRYAIEQDSPDGGWSTHASCWGPTGLRGTVLDETDDLGRAIEIASAAAHSGYPDSCTWIYDRRLGRPVSADRIKAAGGRVSRRYRQFHG